MVPPSDNLNTLHSTGSRRLLVSANPTVPLLSSIKPLLRNARGNRAFGTKSTPLQLSGHTKIPSCLVTQTQVYLPAL